MYQKIWHLYRPTFSLPQQWLTDTEGSLHSSINRSEKGKLCFLSSKYEHEFTSSKAHSHLSSDQCIWVGIVPDDGEGNGTRLQFSCLENPMDGGAWWAAVHGVARGWTQLSDFTFTFPFHALEKEMAAHSSVLAWRNPGRGEPGGLPSMGSTRLKRLSSSSSSSRWGFYSSKSL